MLRRRLQEIHADRRQREVVARRQAGLEEEPGLVGLGDDDAVDLDPDVRLLARMSTRVCGSRGWTKISSSSSNQWSMADHLDDDEAVGAFAATRRP